MESIQNGGLFTVRLFTSDGGVRFACVRLASHLFGNFKTVDCLQLGHSPLCHLRDRGN
jgi:hypothetical protein